MSLRFLSIGEDLWVHEKKNSLREPNDAQWHGHRPKFKRQWNRHCSDRPQFGKRLEERREGLVRRRSSLLSLYLYTLSRISNVNGAICWITRNLNQPTGTPAPMCSPPHTSPSPTTSFVLTQQQGVSARAGTVTRPPVHLPVFPQRAKTTGHRTTQRKGEIQSFNERLVFYHLFVNAR